MQAEKSLQFTYLQSPRPPTIPRESNLFGVLDVDIFLASAESTER